MDVHLNIKGCYATQLRPLRQVSRKRGQRNSAFAEPGYSKHHSTTLSLPCFHLQFQNDYQRRFPFLGRLDFLTFSFPLVNSMKDAVSSSSPSSSLICSANSSFSDPTSSILALTESSFAKDHKNVFSLTLSLISSTLAFGKLRWPVIAGDQT